jgi:phosphatidylserine/phosphatidylglycerophosphate/cardiolipin synthase-like enzyme
MWMRDMPRRIAPTSYARRVAETPKNRRAKVSLIADREHYDEVVVGTILKAQTSVWIATANVKDMHVEAPIGTTARARGKFISMLESLRDLARRGVEVRILHGANPSGPFRAQLARLQATTGKKIGVAMRHCPRVHLKLIAIDGSALYLGSANFTGAGLGAKGDGRRNFEMGVLTDDEILLDAAQARFDRIWSGKECASCKLRRECPKPIDTLPKRGIVPA